MNEQLENLELRISHLLRAGVILAGIFLAIGWVGQLAGGHVSLASLHSYTTEPILTALESAYRTADWGTLVCFIGLFVLISLPLLRVLMTAVLLWRQHDRILASAAILVFVVIITSAFLGLEL